MKLIVKMGRDGCCLHVAEHMLEKSQNYLKTNLKITLKLII
jgi:hypothetical protein